MKVPGTHKESISVSLTLLLIKKKILLELYLPSSFTLTVLYWKWEPVCTVSTPKRDERVPQPVTVTEELFEF